tara:strand:- start:1218 stop:2192 length:975 start_codon:yes stop_codon:yes gene_type:complete
MNSNINSNLVPSEDNNLVKINQFILDRLQKKYKNQDLMRYNIHQKIKNILDVKINKQNQKISKQLIEDLLLKLNEYLSKNLEPNLNSNRNNQLNNLFNQKTETFNNFQIKEKHSNFFDFKTSTLLQNNNTQPTVNPNSNLIDSKIGNGILSTSLINNNLEEFTNTESLDKKKSIYIFIDSKDRDYKKYEFPNNYTIDLSKYNLNKVKTIELVNCTMIKSEKDPQSSDATFSIPYLGLKVNNFNNSIGSNETLDNHFAVLTDYELKNNFKYFKDINAYCTFTSPYKLDKINIQIYLPNGELFNFGYNNNLSYHTINFFTFKITNF